MADSIAAQVAAATAEPAQAPAQSPASTQARTPGGQFDKGNVLPIEKQAAQGEQKPKAETVAEKRYRLKMGDKEEEFDEHTLVGLASRGRNAAQLMSKADKVRADAEKRVKDAESKLERLKKDPFAVLRELGADPLKLSEEQILRALEEEKEKQLPPEERALRQKAREADELRAKLKEREEQEQSAQEEQEVQRQREQLESLFTDVMTRTGLPKTSARAVMHRVAAVVQAAEAYGEKVDPDEAAFHVMENIRQEQRAVIQGMSVPELADWLGPELMLSIRKHDLQAYRQKRTGAAPPPPAVAPAAPRPQVNPNSRRGRWDLIDRVIKGG